MTRSLLIAIAFVVAATSAVTAQIIPPLYRCIDTGDPSTCLLENVIVSKARPNFRIRAEDPDQVRMVVIRNSSIPLLINNICRAFLNLRSIEAKRISIEEIREDAFEECPRLVSVDFSDNLITELPHNLFNNSENLEFVYMDKNFIQELHEDVFSGTTKLGAIGFNQNRLKEVPLAALKHNDNLRGIYVHSNDILNFNEEKIAEMFPALETFEFNNNELSCERQLHIQDFLRQRSIAFPYTALPRQRFHEVTKVGDILCVGDVEWTGVYYKRVAEHNQMEALRRKVKQLESQMAEDLGAIKEMMAKLSNID